MPPTVPSDKLPPQNLEAERSLLGALLVDREAISRVIDQVGAEDFYQKNHQDIFAAVADLFTKRENVDILSVSTRLADVGKLDAIGGIGALTALAEAVPTSAHVLTYARIVQRKKTLRDLVDTAHRILALGHQEGEDVDAVLAEAEQQLFAVTQKTVGHQLEALPPHYVAAIERAQNVDTGQLRGIGTGHKKLDQTLGGFQKSDLIIVAARPSVGKTAFALDIARRVAVNQNIPVGVFSLEMSMDQVVDRLIAAQGNVSLWRMRTGNMKHEGENSDFARMTDAVSRLREAPIFVDDTPGLNVLQMRAMARRMKVEHGLGMLVVDYLQLMSARKNYDSMVNQVTEISRGLKALAKELSIPVVALSQLSRAVETREGGGGKPRLSDLRDSGSIEQDADLVMFIHREDKVNFQSAQTAGTLNTAKLLIAKHRNGPTGEIDFMINPDTLRFDEREDRFDPDLYS